MKKFTESGIRLPAVAGSFYPADKNQLATNLDQFFQKVTGVNRNPPDGCKAIVVPHAGYIYSGQTAAWGYQQLTPIENQHFVLIGPSHNYFFNGLVFSDFNFWETPLGLVKHRIPTETNVTKLYNEPHITEHSLEVQLPFLQTLYGSFSFTGFLTGKNIDIEEAADYFLTNFPNSIFIVSSDLSHYLPYDQAKQKDGRTIEHVLKLDADNILSGDNIACGNCGIAILIAMAKKKNWRGKLIKYDTSATASGDQSAVVGYTSIVFV